MFVCLSISLCLSLSLCVSLSKKNCHKKRVLGEVQLYVLSSSFSFSFPLFLHFHLSCPLLLFLLFSPLPSLLIHNLSSSPLIFFRLCCLTQMSCLPLFPSLPLSSPLFPSPPLSSPLLPSLPLFFYLSLFLSPPISLSSNPNFCRALVM